MKRVFGVLLILIVGGVAALLWFARPYLSGWARSRLENELTRLTGAPSTIDELTVSVLPVRIHVGGVAIGTTPALVRITSIDASLAALSSLAEGRAVVSVRVESPTFDLSQLPKTDDLSQLPKTETPGAETKRTPAAASIRVPPLDLTELEIRHAALKFRMGNTTADLAVEQLRGELKAGIVRQGFTAALTVSGAELRRKSYRAKLDEIHAEGGMDGGGLYVSSASVTGDRITATATATRVPHRHVVEATFDPGLLGVVVDELSLVSGQAHVTGTVTGDLIDPLSEGQLTVQQGAIAHHVLGDLSTHVTHRGAKLGFDNVRLSGAGGQVTGAVDLVVVKEVPIHGELAWQGIDIERMLAIIGPEIPFNDQFSATTSVHGSLDPLDLDVKATGSLQPTLVSTTTDAASFTLNGRVYPHDLEAQLEVVQPERNTLTTRVLINRDTFGGTVRLTAANLAALNALLPRPVPTLALTGEGEGDAEFGGTTEHPTVSGKLSLRDPTIVGTRMARLNGDFMIAAGTLRTQATAVETTGGQIGLDGVIALDTERSNDWRLALHDLDTDVVLGAVRGFTDVQTPVSGGTVNGTFACRGPWPRTQTQAALTATALRIGAEPLDHVDIEATTALPQWTGKLTAVRTANETVSVTGTGEGKTRIDLRLETTPLNLATLRGVGRRRILGTVTAHGHLLGKPLQSGGTVEIDARNLGLGSHRLGAVGLRAEGSDGNWTVNGAAFGDSLTIAGTLHSTAGFPYTTTVTWHDTDLAPVIAADESLHVTTSGTLNLAGSLRAPATPSGALRVDQFVLRRDQGQAEASEPMRVDLDHGRFRIGALALAAPGGRVSVSGEGTVAGDLDLDVRGDGDLVLLELIGGPLHSARGAFAVGAHIGHRHASGWDLHGQATVRDAALDLGLPLAFTATNATFSLIGGVVRIDQLSGHAGGGEFAVGGRLDLNHGPAVSWSVHEVSLTLPEWLEERISGKGQVQGTWNAMTVDGDIEVLNALYDRRIELSALLPWFKEQLAPTPQLGPPRREVRLDLHIHAPDGLFVDNNFAKVEMRCDLRITGLAQQPSIGGLIEVLNGEVTFRDHVFRITGGSIGFQDPYRINPMLNINAESQISTTEGEYTVSAAVSGTADSPRVQFTADDPSLTQNDVLSLVTLGQTSSQAQRESGGVGVGDVLALVPSEYTGDVRGRVRSLFGVDRFEVEPAYVRDTGAIEPRVTIGKDITARLRALASSSFGVEARNSTQLEYRITRRISLLGTWESRTQQQAGAFGGDVKFRYEFRKLPFSLFGDSAASPRNDAQ